MVEQYFNTELSDIVFEQDSLAEWKSIVDELGLENQAELAKGKTSPIPFPCMNEVMKRTYETLCPVKVDFKQYKKTPMPLEVIKSIKLAVNDNHFQKIEVWYDDKTPDPLVVGVTGKYSAYDFSGYFDTVQGLIEVAKKAGKDIAKNNINLYQKERYLIARWGDELRPFDELKKMAIEVFIENNGGEMNRKVEELKQKLALIRENTVSYFNGNIDKHQVTRD